MTLNFVVSNAISSILTPSQVLHAGLHMKLCVQVYTLFGILCLAFIMLLIVTAFIAVALAYFQLAAEVLLFVSCFICLFDIQNYVSTI